MVRLTYLQGSTDPCPTNQTVTGMQGSLFTTRENEFFWRDKISKMSISNNNGNQKQEGWHLDTPRSKVLTLGPTQLLSTESSAQLASRRGATVLSQRLATMHAEPMYILCTITPPPTHTHLTVLSGTHGRETHTHTHTPTVIAISPRLRIPSATAGSSSKKRSFRYCKGVNDFVYPHT